MSSSTAMHQQLPQRRRSARALPALLVASASAALAPSVLFLGWRAAPLVGTGARPQAAAPRLRAATARSAWGAEGDAKASLMDLLEDGALQQEILQPYGRAMRGRVDEAILELERTNPTDEPAYSELLDGAWKVKYAGTYAPTSLSSPTRELALFLYGGGYSPSNVLASVSAGLWGQALGLELGERRLQISMGRDVQASAEVTVAGQTETLRYDAELMPLSGARLSEEVVGLELPGPVGKLDAPFELRRSMLVTYLDDEVLIVRDESGVPEVLVKELVEVTPAEPLEVEDAVEVNSTAAENATVAANTTVA